LNTGNILSEIRIFDRIKQDIRTGVMEYWMNGVVEFIEYLVDICPKTHYSLSAAGRQYPTDPFYFNPVNPVDPVKVF